MSTRIASHRLNLVCAALAALALVAGCSKNDSTQAAANEDAASNTAATQSTDQAAPDQAAGNQAAADQGATEQGAPAQATGARGVQVAQAPAPAPLPPRADRDEDVVPAPAAQDGGQDDVDNGAGGQSYAYEDPDQQEVVSAYVDPPLAEPAPVEVEWAPPPMLVEDVPPQPGPDYVWTGGYWGWQGRWIWCAGRWSHPPRHHYHWQEPYYEHRGDRVVFVPGYWAAPDSRFVAPAIGVAIAAAFVAAGVHHGHAPDGPQGVFVPPPPGSRPGIIVPAPLGTPPAVVLGAPPVIHAGMRVEGNVENNSHNTTIVNNIRNVTIIAPQGTTANGQRFQTTVAAQSHPMPGVKPVVAVMAPKPASPTAIPAYRPGQKPVALPPPHQVVRRGPMPVRPGESAQAVAGRVPQPGTGPLSAHGEGPGTPPQQQAQRGREQGGPIQARPDPNANAAWQAHERAEAAQGQQALRDQQAQRESQEAQARAQQQSQAKLQQEAAAQQRAQQQAAQQHAQQEAAQAQARQREQQEAQQRSQQAAQQHAQQEAAQAQARQREQQEAQQRSQQAAQQHAQQEAAQAQARQREQQEAQQRSQQAAQQHAQQEAAQAQARQREQAQKEQAERKDQQQRRDDNNGQNQR
ncbi:MAG: hypothetical protein ACTHL8_10710 [Burkholderiaceae bacterium]